MYKVISNKQYSFELSIHEKSRKKLSQFPQKYSSSTTFQQRYLYNIFIELQTSILEFLLFFLCF